MAEVGEFIRNRPDSDAYTGGGVLIHPNVVQVVIRKDAPALWEAVRERFGDAVTVRWGVDRYSHAPGPPE